MIELTREEKDFLIAHKTLLQQNKLSELFKSLRYAQPDDMLEHISQFLVDKLGTKIFKYFEYIPDYTFCDIDFSNVCDGILKLPENITSIKFAAFSGSSGYHTLILSTSDIEDGAFEEINDLKKVIFQDIDAYSFLEDIGFVGFETCDNLRDIYLPFCKEEYVYERNTNSWTEHDLWGEIPLESADYDILRLIFGKHDAHKMNCTVHWGDD